MEGRLYSIPRVVRRPTWNEKGPRFRVPEPQPSSLGLSGRPSSRLPQVRRADSRCRRLEPTTLIDGLPKGRDSVTPAPVAKVVCHRDERVKGRQ
jgi:hypothetical protein